MRLRISIWVTAALLALLGLPQLNAKDTNEQLAEELRQQKSKINEHNMSVSGAMFRGDFKSAAEQQEAMLALTRQCYGEKHWRFQFAARSATDCRYHFVLG